MIGQYVQAVGASLEVVLGVAMRLAMPAAIVLGLAALAVGLTALLQKDHALLRRWDWTLVKPRLLDIAAVGAVFIAGWSGLRAALPIARQDLAWREAAEATANPTPDAPPASQFGPSVGAMAERTYTRTLSLPPDFLQRIGEQGIGVLSPYLSDPTAENVLKLADTFRRSGQEVVFTRSVTRLDEEPIPFSSSSVRVSFRRLAGRAYDAAFEGTYLFENRGAEAITARFQFPLPGAGTVRDLSIQIGGTAVPETATSGAYTWTGKLEPGERKEALVRYRVLGTRTWRYDLGSVRRRVQQFRLDVSPGGPVRYLRGSLQPTVSSGKELRWDLSNVVTAQQIAISLPAGTEGKETYLQALSALPASLVVFAVAIAALGLRLRRMPATGSLAGGLVTFTLGLGACVVAANYLGPVAALILCPVAGALLTARVLGPRSLAASIPVAFLPAAFLSPHHSGLICLSLALLLLALHRIAADRPVTGRPA